MSAREDYLAYALSQRVRHACSGQSAELVTVELIASLGEMIGRAPYRDRAAILKDVIAHLTQYVSEIPP